MVKSGHSPWAAYSRCKDARDSNKLINTGRPLRSLSSLPLSLPPSTAPALSHKTKRIFYIVFLIDHATLLLATSDSLCYSKRQCDLALLLVWELGTQETRFQPLWERHLCGHIPKNYIIKFYYRINLMIIEAFPTPIINLRLSNETKNTYNKFRVKF